MTRVPSDHAAEAERLIEYAYADDPAVLDGIKAQAHATLALVEAQNTANLIAYLNGPRVLAEDIEPVRDMVRDRLGVRDE